MEKEFEKQIASMTLEEKVSLCSGRDSWFTKGLPQHGILPMRTCDGPSGLRFQGDNDDHIGVRASVKTVSYPTGSAMASSFDRELMYRMGELLGDESRALGVDMVLGPAMNIKRTPLCGRNFEYLSEDPYLSGEMAAAQIQGIQSKQVAACAKHFACNNQELWRMKINAQIDERTLRELYLSGFEIAVKKGRPCALMASYNSINGNTATENYHLLTEILREEWGFDGIVLSDWGATNRRTEALKAGLDLEMPGCSGITDAQLLADAKAGRIDEEVIDQSVRRLIRAAKQYGHETTQGEFDREGHHAFAVEAATQTAVLLKNEEALLPLRTDQHIAVLGAFAETPRFQGGGSACVNPFRTTSFLEHIEDLPCVSYYPAFSAVLDETTEQMRKDALEGAKNAEVAVVFAGLPDIYESECYDRLDLHLPSCQEQMIRDVCAVQQNVVVVLHSGSAVEMPWIGRVGAVLQMHTSGQGVGTAAYQLLFGEANPCGKLAETYPLRLEDTPAYLNYPGDGKDVHYAEGIYVGYRYYDRKKLPVQFPFGHGLSYTQFTYSGLNIETNPGEQSCKVCLRVTNTGSCTGKEVVQLYVSDQTHSLRQRTYDLHANVVVDATEGGVGRPEQELKAFEKIELAPGETKTVTFLLDRRSFCWYDEKHSMWRMYGGEYSIRVGASSRDIRLSETISLPGTPMPELECYTMSSLMSDLCGDETLWTTALEGLSAISPKLKEIIEGTDANSSYLREELKELPLYSIRGIYSVPQQGLEDLLNRINRIAASQR